MSCTFLEDILFVIKEYAEPGTLAAFAVVGGQVVFDPTRGDQEFVQCLREKGLRAADGTVVFPSQGEDFIDACARAFFGEFYDEERQRELIALYAQTPSRPPIAA